VVFFFFLQHYSEYSFSRNYHAMLAFFLSYYVCWVFTVRTDLRNQRLSTAFPPHIIDVSAPNLSIDFFSCHDYWLSPAHLGINGLHSLRLWKLDLQGTMDLILHHLSWLIELECIPHACPTTEAPTTCDQERSL